MQVFSILCFTLVLIKGDFSRHLESYENPFDYSSIKAVTKNEDLSNKIYESINSDECVAYFDENMQLENIDELYNVNLNKKSGESSNFTNSELYGLNSALLINGNKEISFKSINISLSVDNANGLIATNDAYIYIDEIKVISSAAKLSRCFVSTFSGEIFAKKAKLITEGNSSPAVATFGKDRGEIYISGGTIETKGKLSPLIYMNSGIVSLYNVNGNSGKSQIALLDGTGELSIRNSNLKFYGQGEGNVDNCGIKIYKSKQNQNEDNSQLLCSHSTLEIISTSKYFETAPMFYVTNKEISFYFLKCNLIFGSGTILKIGRSNQFGKEGESGGIVTMKIEEQTLEGNIIIDSESEFVLRLYYEAHFIGTINAAKTAKKVKIEIHTGCTLTLTGDSYYTEIRNNEENGENIINGTYTLYKYNTEDRNIDQPEEYKKNEDNEEDNKIMEEEDNDHNKEKDKKMKIIKMAKNQKVILLTYYF